MYLKGFSLMNRFIRTCNILRISLLTQFEKYWSQFSMTAYILCIIISGTDSSYANHYRPTYTPPLSRG